MAFYWGQVCSAAGGGGGHLRNSRSEAPVSRRPPGAVRNHCCAGGRVLALHPVSPHCTPRSPHCTLCSLCCTPRSPRCTPRPPCPRVHLCFSFSRDVASEASAWGSVAHQTGAPRGIEDQARSTPTGVLMHPRARALDPGPWSLVPPPPTDRMWVSCCHRSRPERDPRAFPSSSFRARFPRVAPTHAPPRLGVTLPRLPPLCSP